MCMKVFLITCPHTFRTDLIPCSLCSIDFVYSFKKCFRNFFITKERIQEPIVDRFRGWWGIWAMGVQESRNTIQVYYIRKTFYNYKFPISFWQRKGWVYVYWHGHCGPLWRTLSPIFNIPTYDVKAIMPRDRYRYLIQYQILILNGKKYTSGKIYLCIIKYA